MSHYYHADMRVDGTLWFHSQAQPSTQFYISQPMPVFHNYALTLALAGYIVDPDTGYVSRFGETRYKSPIEIFKRYGVYVYPAVVTRAVLGEVLMAGGNEGNILIRARSRLAYPFFTKNVLFLPNSALETLIISEDRLPHKVVVRIGAKRNGVLRIILNPVSVRELRYVTITHPFNLSDVVKVQGYTVVLPHGAGDIALFGIAERALEYEYRRYGRKQKVVLPVIKGAELW